MTRKEFCEIMAAGHGEAASNLQDAALRSDAAGMERQGNELSHAATVQSALANTFRDLAKEQE